MVRILIACLLAASLPASAGEPRFSLHLEAGTTSFSGAADEARQALWTDPMARLMRAADAELGRLLVGQPGGRTPAAIVVGMRPGLPPHILGAALESSLPRSAEPAITWQWPWAPAQDVPTLEEVVALQLGRTLEQRVGSTDGP